MKRLAIVGAGDLGDQIANLARITGRFELAGFFDDTRAVGETVHGLPVLGVIDDILSAFQEGSFDCLIIAIGYKHIQSRRLIFDRYHEQVPFATLVHPSVIIDPSCQIGPGAVIYSGCILDYRSRIGFNPHRHVSER